MADNNILGLRTCIYLVDDLAKATKWYTLVFEQEPYFEESFYVGFNIGGFELGLQPTKSKSDSKSESILTYWGVDDINKIYSKIIGLGATEHEKPTNVGGPLMVATVKDPWSNIVGFIYNPTFKILEN